MIEEVQQLEHHLMKWMDHKQSRHRALVKLNAIKAELNRLYAVEAAHAKRNRKGKSS